MTIRGSPNPDALARELGEVAHVGARPSALVDLSLPTLFGLGCVQTATSSKNSVDVAFAVVEVVRRAIEELGEGPQGEAARSLFALAPDASGLRLQDRRDKAALILESRANKPWDSFRKGPEKRLLERLAEEIYRFEVPHQVGVRHTSGGNSGSRSRHDGEPEVTAGTERHAGHSFVGRKGELRLLLGGLERAVSGQGSLYLLEGDAGIGKTRLAHELESQAEVLGARVLWASCREEPGAPPHGPWIQLLTHYVHTCDATSLAEHSASSWAEIVRLVPEARLELRGVPPPSPTRLDSGRFRQFNSIITVLKDAARDVPLVIVLDDLHAASVASLRLLEDLARELHNMPILVVGAHRAFDVKSDGKSAEVLTDLAYVSHRIPLRGLDDEELRELLSDITDAPPPDAFVLEVQRATEGNPLFARELTHLALRERRIDRERFIPGRLPIPDTVREVIRRRLRPLSPGVRDLLILAAHVGRDFGVHVLSTVCGVPTNECLDRLVEAVRLQILVQTPESPRHYRFAHGLFGEVLRAEPSPTTKIQLHRRIGEAIETLRADNLEPFLEELAHHFWEAAQLSLESTHKAVEYGKRAGDQAVGLLAYEEGAIHYRRALEVLEECGPPVTQSRGDLYLALGKAEWWSGRREAARWALGRAAESARRLGNPTLLADAALGLGNVGYVPGRLDKELTDVLEEALVLLPPGDSTLRVRLLSRLASELVWDPESARRRDTLSLESVATARRLGDQAILAYSLKERHALMWSPEYLEERMSLVREAMAVARDAANREEELGALGLLCSELLERGGLRAADRHMRRFSLVAQDSRQAFFVWTAKVHTVLRALSEGRLGQVLPLADEALEFGERFVEPNARQIHGIHALIVARETGSLESLIVETERFVTENPGIPAWQAALAWVYAHAGRFEEARREFDELALDDFRGIPLDPFWLSALGPLSEVCALLGDVPRAAILYELLLPYADRHIIVAYFAASLGSVSMYLGILAGTRLRFEDAARHFNVALTAHESESPIWAARTRYHFASTILQDPAGDRNLALHLLDGAIGIANEIGMIGLLERANRLRVDAR